MQFKWDQYSLYGCNIIDCHDFYATTGLFVISVEDDSNNFVSGISSALKRLLCAEEHKTH